MKKDSTFKLIYPITFLLYVGIMHLSIGQIANKWAFDEGIENDPDVIFVEQFEQTSIATMISESGYQTSPMVAHITFDSSVPVGSRGHQSLKLTTVETSNASNDPNEDANILKRFSTGISDSVFVRYYVKFNAEHTFHHTGVWMGGTDPAKSCWPCNIPGRTIPTNGDSAFVVGSEIRGLANQSAQAFSKFGFYNYWMDMRPFTTEPNTGKYFGNEFISPLAPASIDMNEWNCMEVMIKLNNPVTESNGELKLWINGELIAHYGKGFPKGTWSEAFFNEGTGSPFEGFRWRSNPEVVFNYIWLKNYSTSNDLYPSANDVWYDHVVVAKRYIGPISTEDAPIDPLGFGVTADFTLYPNPTKGVLTLTSKTSFSDVTIAIYNTAGDRVQSIDHVSGLRYSFQLEAISGGIYFIRIKDGERVHSSRFIIE